MHYSEVVVDTLPGPTHFFGGLSQGNLASMDSKGWISSPRKAALQSIAKIRLVASLGAKQLLLPPHIRPLSSCLFPSNFSSSFMWTANAGHFSPALDCYDGNAHFTPANLSHFPHRSQETHTTAHLFKTLLTSTHHHPPIHPDLPDEGAANTSRLCPDFTQKGLTIFVYGTTDPEKGTKQGFTSRQSLSACKEIANTHGLDPNYCLFFEQSRKAIDAGVFHNDVVNLSHLNFFLTHESAYQNPSDLETLTTVYQSLYGQAPILCTVRHSELSLEESVKTYLFNSQIVSNSKETILISPLECKENPRSFKVIQGLIQNPRYPIDRAVFVDVEESMKNGGGPACLRLRMVLSLEDYQKIPSQFKFSETKAMALSEFIENNYPETLSLEALKNNVYTETLKTICKQLRVMFFNLVDL